MLKLKTLCFKRSFRVLLLSLLTLLLVGWASTAQAQRLETRCGWFQNPTPANAWLNDRDGRWIIGVQGGYQAMGDWPNIPDNQWVRTNGNYGYGCACMKVVANKPKKQISQIAAASARPLAACRRDPALQEPG
jgi:hypothetical protein